EVTSRTETGDSIPSQVVGERGARLLEAGLRHRDLRSRNRIAPIVGDTPADRARAGHDEIDVVERLTARQLNRRALFERTGLTVPEREIAVAADGQRVAPGREIAQLVTAFGIGADRAAFREFRGSRGDGGQAERTAGVGGGHAAAD